MIKENEKKEQKRETKPIDEKEVMKEQLNLDSDNDIDKNIDTLSSLAYLVLSQESRDQMEALFCKDEEKDDDDWKTVALEIMRKVDARQREEESQIPPSPENQRIEKASSSKIPSNDTLHQALNRICEEDNCQIEEEMKNTKPHVFSAEFERKMEELMKVETPEMKAERRKKKFLGVARYAVAVVVAVVLLGRVFFSGNKNVSASNMKFRIIEWLENAFVVEEGSSVRQDESVLFDVDRIGYLPEGFELTVDDAIFSRIYYKFQNATGDYVTLHVYCDSTNTGIDNQEIFQEIDLNKAGFEYRYVYKKESKEHIISWKDDKGIYYFLYGTVDKDEMIKVMNGIIY